MLKPYEKKAQFYETDQMGVVHHSNYIRWFEEARVDFMEQIGYPYCDASNAGIDFAVLEVNCQYKSMVRFEELVKINVFITSLSQTRMSIAYEVADSVTGTLRAKGETGHCFYNRRTKRPVSLKRELPELYKVLEASVLK